jgi:hypothetical protein
MLSRRNNRMKILEQLVMDCTRFDFTESESLNYINDRTGDKGIERSQYYAIKKRIVANELKDCQSRLVYHTKAGFVINHFKRMDEGEHLQSILFKSLYNVISKPVEEQSAFAISKIASNIMMNSNYLHNMNVASPIVDQMREYIHTVKKTTVESFERSKSIDPLDATAMTLPEGFFKTATVTSRDNSGHPVFEILRKITTVDHKTD